MLRFPIGLLRLRQILLTAGVLLCKWVNPAVAIDGGYATCFLVFTFAGYHLLWVCLLQSMGTLLLLAAD